MAPLQQAGLLTNDDKAKLFSNVELILGVNNTILKQLEMREEDWTFETCLGDVFLALVRSPSSSRLLVVVISLASSCPTVALPPDVHYLHKQLHTSGRYVPATAAAARVHADDRGACAHNDTGLLSCEDSTRPS
jgi:hypothetical protein